MVYHDSVRSTKDFKHQLLNTV